MDAVETAAYLRRWRPSPSVSGEAAAFARQSVAACGPLGQDRARNLLWAAGKLAGYGISAGLEPVPGVLLHPSVIERFAAHAPGLSPVARRTLRTSLRFIARQVVPPWTRRTRRCPANTPSSGTRPRRSPVTWRWPPPSPRRAGAPAHRRLSASAPGPG